ncbi:MAG: hypothetical protein ACYDER_11875 [Ktedonobacteraceae bacterium]
MSEVVVAIIGAVAGGLCTFIVSLLLRSRKIVEYDVSSMPLLRFTPGSSHALAVSVDKSVLTNDDADKGIPIEIKSAYGFQIDFYNSGNEAVIKPSIKISLDEKAAIVEYESVPSSSSSFDIKWIRNDLHPYVLNIVIPYINEHEHFRVRLISTQNANRECDVEVTGLGVKSRQSYRNRPMFIALCCFMLLYVSIASLVLEYLSFLGGTYDPGKAYYFYFSLIASIGFGIGLIVSIRYVNIRRKFRLSLRADWDLKEDKSRNKTGILQKLLS